MKAAKATVILSRESIRQSYIQELLQKGITETKEGTRVEDLDYYAARHELVMAKLKDGTDTNIESPESKWF
jgi:hypothetical protein